MSLAHLAHALHGDVYAGGRRANIPFPGHSRDDCSLSLLLDDNNRVIINTFGGGDWKEAADYLIGLGMIDRRRQLLGSGVARGDLRQNPPVAPRIRAAVARSIWERSRPVVATLGETYARSRGVIRDLPGPSSLRFDRETALSAYNPAARAVGPALLAAILSPDGELTAIEITYLKPNAGATTRCGCRVNRWVWFRRAARSAWTEPDRVFWSGRGSSPACRPARSSGFRHGPS
jgi:putative DNA primase/helicase